MLLQTSTSGKIRIPLCSQNMTNQTISGGLQVQSLFQRPPSQATSVKAEPGSNMGSIASIVNRVCIHQFS